MVKVETRTRSVGIERASDGDASAVRLIYIVWYCVCRYIVACRGLGGVTYLSRYLNYLGMLDRFIPTSHPCSHWQSHAADSAGAFSL
ncbi:hypothetical protein LZ31DRAFT_368109 [Colletotrichum somersetense]|nr:hypothetical protein LZ31DRAFT_368109 [Colletotrichum somersetense]